MSRAPADICLCPGLVRVPQVTQSAQKQRLAFPALPVAQRDRRWSPAPGPALRGPSCDCPGLLEALGPGCLGAHSVWKASLPEDVWRRRHCGFLLGSVVGPACQRRRPRFRPSPGGSRAAGQLSLWATTVEPAPGAPRPQLPKPVCPAASSTATGAPAGGAVHRTQENPAEPRAWRSHKEKKSNPCK